MSEQTESDALTLIDELIDGPSKGEFYGINDVLRAKLRTIRYAFTSQRNAVVEECAKAADDYAASCLMERGNAGAMNDRRAAEKADSARLASEDIAQAIRALATKEPSDEA